MNILVVAPSWIGDTLLAQPLLTLLKRQDPKARVDVLAAPWTAPVLERMRETGTVIANPFGHGTLAFGARRSFGRSLAAAGYARAYVLPNSWKSALVPFFAGIPERIGYVGEARYGLLNRAVRLDTYRHPQQIQRYAALAGPLPEQLPLPRLESTPEQQEQARRSLGLDPGVRPVVFCPGAEFGPAKRWPTRHFAALAQRLAGQGHSVWLVGSDKDAPFGREIAELSGGAAVDLCGRTALSQAIDLIAGASCVVSNDSGLMHVAAALGRPLVAVYGSSSPDYTPPATPDARILARSLPCAPCFKRRCPLGHLDCLEGLEPATVEAAVVETLAA